MAEFNISRDPIVRLYADELSDRIESFASEAVRVCYRAKKSLDGNPRVPGIERTTAYSKFVGTEDAQRQYFGSIPQLAPHEAISLMRDCHRAASEGLEYFRGTRHHFQRSTSIDRDLRVLKLSSLTIGSRIDVLDKAIGGDTEALKAVYAAILGEKLDQLDAPYLFEVIDSVVELSSPAEFDLASNAKEGLALLIKTANDLAGSLISTNLDKRFLGALNDYIEALADQNFSPIKVDLLSNRLRTYLTEMKDELPAFAIAEVSALLLSQERVLRQFPTWRQFEAEASNYEPDDQTAEHQKALLEDITTQTKTTDGIATPNVLDALDRLLETNAEPTTKQTTALGVWRSVENFLKTNIRHMIGFGKSLQANLTLNQARYAKYLERLIPSLKLYASLDPSHAWLLPVIHWLEDTLKALKK